MKKRILTLGITWMLFAIGMAQEQVDSLKRLDSIDIVDTINLANLPLIIEEMAHAIVCQDSLVTQLMHDKRIGYVRGEQVKNGFRVQIYASNHQQVAKKEATELQQHIETAIDVPVYTISEPPFWKVRIGNFESRESANEYKAIFLQLFPELISSTYIVPDKIILLQ